MKRLPQFWLALFASFLAWSAVHAQFSGGDYFQMAEKYKRNDKLKEAIFHYDSAIHFEPHNFRFHFEKGKCHLLIHEEDHAIRAFERTVQLMPNHVESYTRLAWLYERKEDYKELIRCLEMAVVHNTEDIYKIEYKLRIIKTLQMLNRFNEAGRHIDEAQRMATRESAAYADILYYRAKFQNFYGDYDSAIATMKDALYVSQSAEDQYTAKFYYELGYAYYHLGEFRNARAAFSYAKYDDFKPLIARLSPEYNFSIARAYNRISLFKPAIESINKCLHYDNDFAEAIELLKDINYRLGNLGAIKMKTAAAAVERNPDLKAQKFVELGELQIAADRFDAAIRSADSVFAINPKHLGAFLMKGSAHYLMGDTQRAIKSLTQVVNAIYASNEERAQAHLLLGIIYKDKHQWADAIENFSKANQGMFSNIAEYEESQIKLMRKP